MGAYLGQPELMSLVYANGPAPKGKNNKGNTGPTLNQSVLTSLRVLDEQNALSRFTWTNLPKGLNATLVERILYYRGRGMLFYMESNKKFYFLPFSLSGGIDVYGRYNGCTPVPFNGTNQTTDAWINGLVRTPEYDIILPKDLTYNDIINKCVVLNDYPQQLSQTIIPRYQLQEPILQVMAETIPFCRTSMLNGTGVNGVYVQTQDESASVIAASNAVTEAAINGQKWVPIQNGLQLTELTAGSAQRPEEFLMVLQSLDNYRLSLHGLSSGGLFQKGSHMLQAEQDMNANRSKSVLDEGLKLRQEFCDIVNSIWGTGTWCEISESALYIDRNGDGEASSSRLPELPEATTTETVEEEVIEE